MGNPSEKPHGLCLFFITVLGLALVITIVCGVETVKQNVRLLSTRVYTNVTNNLNPVYITNTVAELRSRNYRVVQTRDGRYWIEFATWHRVESISNAPAEELFGFVQHAENRRVECRPPSAQFWVGGSNTINVVEFMEAYSNVVNWVPPYRVVGEVNK